MDYTFAKSMESYLGSILNVTKGRHEAKYKIINLFEVGELYHLLFEVGELYHLATDKEWYLVAELQTNSQRRYFSKFFYITFDSEDEARVFIRKYIDGKEVLAMDMARGAY